MGVGVAAGDVAQEHALGAGAGVVADGGVLQGPVDAEAELAEECFEYFFVFLGELFAQFDEVHAGNGDLFFRVWFGGWGEVGVVGQGWVAADTVIVLDAAFGGEAVVIPAHGVEHGFAAHALVAGDDVGVGVGEHVADVE